MPAWERERGELPAPIWPLFGRKTGQGLDVFCTRRAGIPARSNVQIPSVLAFAKALELNLSGPYSHSIVPGGLLVMSKQTRLTPFTSLMMRLESRSISS